MDGDLPPAFCSMVGNYLRGRAFHLPMKPVALLLCLLVALCCTARGEETTTAFDWERAKALHQRAQKGEALSPDEQKIVDEAKRRFAAGQGAGAETGKASAGDGFDWKRAQDLFRRKRGGESLSATDQAFLDEALKRRGQGGRPQSLRPQTLPPDTKPSEAAKGLVPLTELTGDYHGLDGGLYGSGNNEVPAAQQALADKAVASIQPLDSDGKASAIGKVVLMSVGMSNTTNEFSRFVPLANSDPRKSASLVVVDGAQGGQTAQIWADRDAKPWGVAEQRLEAAGVKPAQVQILWIKQANAGPKAGREAEIKRLQDDMEKLVQNAKRKYPNLRLAFLSSRIYGGYAQTSLNPEPYAYEGAFSMRGLIQKQMSGDAGLNADPSKGDVKSPVLLWGPYLWAAGATPRQEDGLTYQVEDFVGDGTHPSPSGAAKVAKLLLDFFTTDTNAKHWFTKP
jgi:hypothetical protein